MRSNPDNVQPSDELRSELQHQGLIEMLLPVYKAAGFDVTKMDKVIHDIESIIAAETRKVRESTKLYEQWVEAIGEGCWCDHNGNCQAHFVQPADECIYKLTKDRIAELQKEQAPDA